MKKLISILVILAIILGITAALVVANINPILEKLKPQIVAKITKIVKQPVELGQLDLSIFPNPGIKIKDVVIQNRTTKTPAAKLDSLFLETGLSGLMKGKVSVNTLQIQDSFVSIKRKKDGLVYLGDFALNGKKQTSKNIIGKNTSDKDAPTNKLAETTTKKEDKSASIDFALENLDINGLNIEWEDQSVSPVAKVNLKDFSINAKNVGNKTKGDFDITGSLLGTRSKNLKVNGDISLGEKTAGIPHTNSKINFSSIDLNQVQALMSSYGVKVENLKMSKSLDLALNVSTGNDGINITPAINATSADISLGDTFKKPSGTSLKVEAKAQPGLLGGITASKVEITVADQKLSAPLQHSVKNGTKLKISSNNFSLQEVLKLIPSLSKYSISGTLAPNLDVFLSKNKKASLLPADITGELGINGLNVQMPGANSPIIKSLDTKLTFIKNGLNINPINIFDGNGRTDVSFQGATGINAKLNLNKLSLEKISETYLKGGSYMISGIIEKMNSNINMNTKNPQASLKGDADFLMQNGEILGFNIFKETLSKITNIPGLDSALIAFIPEKYSHLANNKNTKFDTISLTTDFANSNANIKNFSLQHTAYKIEGNGTASFSGNLNLKSKLIIAAEVANEMVLKKPKLKLLQQADKSIAIPILIKKNGKTPVVLPDVSELIKTAGKATAIEAGKKALEKIAPGLGDAAPAIEKIGEKLGDNLGNALKSLF